MDNLQHAYPELSPDERRAIAKGAYVNMARAALDGLLAFELMKKSSWEVQRTRWEPLADALASGNGVILVGAHYGSWEVLGGLLPKWGLSLNAVMKPLRGSLNAKLLEARQKNGAKAILPRGSMIGTLRALRRGEVVLMLFDQVLPAKQGVFVPFFGRPACTTPAVSWAALKSKAPVFLILSRWEGNTFHISVEGPFPIHGDSQEDVVRHTAELTSALERNIRKHPSQWLWLHRRWKVQPLSPCSMK